MNIGQHYFHNVNFRFAQILIMKIMLTDIHGIFPQSGVRLSDGRFKNDSFGSDSVWRQYKGDDHREEAPFFSSCPSQSRKDSSRKF